MVEYRLHDQLVKGGDRVFSYFKSGGKTHGVCYLENDEMICKDHAISLLKVKKR